MSRFGRKLAMLTMVVPAILGWCTLVIAAALTVEEGWIYYVARILLGRLNADFYLFSGALYRVCSDHIQLYVYSTGSFRYDVNHE